MTTTISDLMTTNLVMLDENATAQDAARMMRDSAIGDVIVTRNGRICGIVTDRDIVVRCVADGEDPAESKLGEMCSDELVTLSPDDPVDRAVQLMRENAVRRLPVVDNDRPVGIVSIGDLAQDRDRGSALAEISAAPPQR